MREEEDRVNYKKRRVVLSTLILIALIILIFLVIKYLGRIEHEPLIPTGNVDIFDIIFVSKTECNCGCGCESSPNPNCKCNMKDCICHQYLFMVDTEDDNSNSGNGFLVGNKQNTSNHGNTGKPSSGTSNPGSSSGSNPNDNPSGQTPGFPEIGGGDNKPDDDVGGGNNSGSLEVYDEDDVKFYQSTKLNIFKQASYHIVKNKIAPTSENSYQFIIRNNNNFNLKYNLEMFEENKYNINMRYRLKLNGEYVVGDDNNYVDVDELNCYNLNLPKHTYDVYTLDWKWVESDNDTKVADSSIDATYTLNLKVSAEEV